MSVPDPPRLEHYQIHATRNGAVISFRATDDAGLASFHERFPRAWWQKGYDQWFVRNADGTEAEHELLAWRKQHVISHGGSGTYDA